MEERDWEKAHREKRRIFYEKATETIRTCPENYLVAVSREEGGGKVWTATPDAALSTPTKEEIQKIHYERDLAECERSVVQLEAEGYDLDRAAEVKTLVALAPDGRKQHLERIRRYYRQAPVGPMVPVYGGPVEGGDGGEQFTQADLDRAHQYMRAHPGCEWDAAEQYAREGRGK